MALIGYARVSNDEQNLSLQLDALKKAGCVRIFKDKLTGTKFEERKQFQAALDYLNVDDTLVVWKLDRLGRSLKQLILTLETLQKQKMHLVSLTEHIDTSTATGMLFFQFIAMLAEFERNLISERTRAGLTSARARGRVGGRPKVNLTKGKPALALRLYDEKQTEIDEICKALTISRPTLFRWVRLRNEQQQKTS